MKFEHQNTSKSKVDKFKNYNMITEKIFKFKTLSQFVCINAYVRSFIPIIWAPKCLQIKKCSIQKLLKISKPTPLLYNKILNSKHFYNLSI